MILVEIRAQLRDPVRNGGRDAAGLLVHLQHDASLNGFIPRGWVPRADRRPPRSFEEHVKANQAIYNLRDSVPGQASLREMRFGLFGR